MPNRTTPPESGNVPELNLALPVIQIIHPGHIDENGNWDTDLDEWELTISEAKRLCFDLGRALGLCVHEYEE